MNFQKALLIFIACLTVALLVLVGLYARSCVTSSNATTTGGGTLTLSGTDPTTLDPALTSDTNSSGYIVQLFSGLVMLDDNLEPAPDIAESWDVSDDGRTFTFHLRDDVYFHDGTAVTADDFKYSWERACNPATGSTTASTYLNDIVGTADVLSGQAADISGVQVLDDRTLQVTIDAPKSFFLAKLTYPTAFVVDQNNVEDTSLSTWWLQPNGTGPFSLNVWYYGSKLVLQRNDDYHGQVASLEFVQYKMFAGDDMSLYETGDIDVAAVYTTTIDRVTDPSGAFYTQYHAYPQLSYTWIGFNTNEPPFDNINVRKAFAMAIDKDKIIDLGLRNLVTRADGVLPDGMPGFNENLIALDFDVDQAQALIAASSYGSVENLPPVVLTVSGYGADVAPILQAVIVQWRENLGVDVTIRQLETDFFIYHLSDEVDNMYYMGWIADYPHPQDFLDILFHSGMQYNYGNYSNPAIDSILDQAGVEKDYDQSLELYRQAEQMLVDDAAMIPLWFGQTLILVKPYVQNYVPNALGHVMLNKVTLLAH